MLFAALPFVPLLAALTSAFVIPISVPPPDKVQEMIKDLEALAAEGVHHLEVNPFFYQAKLSIPDTGNFVELNFFGNPLKRNVLRMNNHDIFRAVEFNPLVAKLNSTGKLVPLGYEAFVDMTSPGVRNVRVHVFSVNGIPTERHMDIVDITVTEDRKGILMITAAKIRHPTAAEASVLDCKFNVFCRARAYFRDKLNRAKHVFQHTKKMGCHGIMNRLKHKHDAEKAAAIDNLLKEAENHEAAEEHRHRPSMGHQIKKVIIYLLAGVFAGFGCSILGLMIGHIVIMGYRFITGRSNIRQGYMAAAADDVEEDDGLLHSKIVLGESELPTYVDSEGLVRGDEKEEN